MTLAEAGGWCLGGVIVVFLILLVYILIRGATREYNYHEQHFDNIRFHPDQWADIPPERSSRWSLFRR